MLTWFLSMQILIVTVRHRRSYILVKAPPRLLKFTPGSIARRRLLAQVVAHIARQKAESKGWLPGKMPLCPTERGFDLLFSQGVVEEAQIIPLDPIYRAKKPVIR